MGSTTRRLGAAVLGAVALTFASGAARAEDAPLPAPTPAAPATEPPPPEAPPAPPAPPASPPPQPPSDAPPPPAAPEVGAPPAPDAPKADAPKPEILPADVPPKVEPPPAPTAAEKSAVGRVLPSDAPVAVKPWTTPCCFHGTLAMRFRSRAGDGESDNDLYQYGTVTYRKDSDVGWSGSFYGRLAEDLDGDQDNDGFYVFDGVDDTFDSAVTGRLYHLYASYRFASGFLERVRVGRQDVDGGYPFLVDGVHVRTAPTGCGELQVAAFAGVPAHIYEASPEGDFIGGVGVAVRPWRGGDLKLDYVYVEDENEFYGQPTNNLITAELRQRFSEWTNGRFWYQQVDDDPRELGVSGTSFSPRLNATVRGSFRTQPEEENALVYDLDPYYAIEQTLQPYWDAHLAVAKSLSDCVTVEVGGTGRALYDDDDEGTFNREFGRVYATVSLDGWPRTCWSFSATGDYWVSDDEDTFAGGFEARYKPSDVIRLVTGVDYSLYRTDLYTASERMDSWVGYVRATYAPTTRWAFDLGVRLEDDDVDTFVTVNAGVRFEF